MMTIRGQAIVILKNRNNFKDRNQNRDRKIFDIPSPAFVSLKSTKAFNKWQTQHYSKQIAKI